MIKLILKTFAIIILELFNEVLNILKNTTFLLI